MTLNEVRQKYLEYFKGKAHEEVPSASLVPENDPTTLFTGSGMQPLIPYLLGARHPKGSRIVNSQKCFRAEDIDEVGDNRHTTFFEMLGNWSLGDYFKKEQLQWFFEFLTHDIGLDPGKLYVTVFAGDEKTGIARDDESIEIWQKLFAVHGTEARGAFMGTEEEGAKRGIKMGERIFYYGAKKNWWSRSGVPDNMPPGEPGGPDSEVFYCFEEIEHDPRFGEHCHPNCDCGRFMEIGNSVFMEFRKLENGDFEKLPQRNVDFGGGLERITAASRADNDMFKIDVFAPVISALEDLFGKTYGDKPDGWYIKGSDTDQLVVRKAFRIIADHLRAATFMMADGVAPSNKERGYILRRLIRKAVFEGYKRGQFPPIWTSNIARHYIDYYRDQYPALKEKEREICEELTNETKKFFGTLETGLKMFDKYTASRARGEKNAISGEEAFILFTTYGFPLELTCEKAGETRMAVDKAGFWEEMKKHQELSRTSTAGVFKGGLADHSEIIVRFHTATHLMNAALRKVLGNNVWQKGSNITSERTRFDFTHSTKMTEEEKKQVEELVNGWISRDLSVRKDIMPYEEARKLEAIGVFGEKYPDTVNVYTVYDPKTDEVISREFCGGPHVERTGVIGKFKILKEEAVAAGIRRIKAAIE